MTIQQHSPMHPGVFIKRVYVTPFNIVSSELARRLQVSPGLVSRLLNGKTDVSPTMALKLSKVLGRSPESWLLMQDNFDLAQTKNQIDITMLEPISFAGVVESENFS